MLDALKNDLLNLGRPKIAASFYCDPAIVRRPAGAADRQGRAVNRHADQREILLVLDGECEIFFDGGIYRLFPGCALLIDSGEEHRRALMKQGVLSSPPSPLKTCARELGFSSPQAFARWKKQYEEEILSLPYDRKVRKTC